MWVAQVEHVSGIGQAKKTVEFARELSTYHTNVLDWEKAGRITKTEFIVRAASILGVTVEELLGLPKTRNNPIAGGKARPGLRGRREASAKQTGEGYRAARRLRRPAFHRSFFLFVDQDFR